MAGYTKSTKFPYDVYEFHIDMKNVAGRIRHVNEDARVITLQLDGDELDAALWGLENYTKPTTT